VGSAVNSLEFFFAWLMSLSPASTPVPHGYPVLKRSLTG